MTVALVTPVDGDGGRMTVRAAERARRGREPVDERVATLAQFSSAYRQLVSASAGRYESTGLLTAGASTHSTPYQMLIAASLPWLASQLGTPGVPRVPLPGPVNPPSVN